MKIIDMETYPRRSHFEYFGSLAYPYMGMSANMDVTNILARARELGGSTFIACLWAASRALNSVPELRQRVIDGQIVEFDHCDAGHTVALSDGTFSSCRTDCRCDLPEFLKVAGAKHEAAKQRHGFNHEDDEICMFFVSCIPWVSFTQVIQPTPTPGDWFPRVVFGKFIREGDKTLMPLAIQCNHGLVDGFHVGQFYAAFEKINEELKR